MRKRPNNLIKFERNAIQVSNPIGQQPLQPELIEKRKVEEPNVPPPKRKEQLEMPRGMKIDNTISGLKERLIALLNYDKPLLEIDQMFECECISRITGKKPKKNRESFGGENKRESKQSPLEVPRRSIGKPKSSYFDELPWKQGIPAIQFPPQFGPAPNYLDPAPNYLEIISQNEHLHPTLQEVFEPSFNSDQRLDPAYIRIPPTQPAAKDYIILPEEEESFDFFAQR